MKKSLLPLASVVRPAALAAVFLLVLAAGPCPSSRAQSAPASVVGTNDDSQLPVFYPFVAQRPVRVGGVLTYQVAADNPPVTYTAENLPPGTQFDTTSGLISGITTQEGTFDVKLSATNAAGTSTTTLTLVVDPPLPVISLVAEVPNGYPEQGVRSSFLLTRNGDLSEPLTVSLIIKGSAKIGQDYSQIKQSIKFKPGKDTKRIFVNAANQSGKGFAKRTVKLFLQTSDTYTLGEENIAKVKIHYTP